MLTSACSFCDAAEWIQLLPHFVVLVQSPPLSLLLPLLQLLYFFQIVDQYLPDCHVFVGGVFIEVSWHSWVRHILTSYPLQVASRAHTCLLHLLIKLANEPNVRQVNVNYIYMLARKCYGTGIVNLLGFWSVWLAVRHLNFGLALFCKISVFSSYCPLVVKIKFIHHTIAWSQACCHSMLHSADWQLVTSISGQPVGPVVKGQAVRDL